MLSIGMFTRLVGEFDVGAGADPSLIPMAPEEDAVARKFTNSVKLSMLSSSTLVKLIITFLTQSA